MKKKEERFAPSKDQRLQRKWCVSDVRAANGLESTHQQILKLARNYKGLEGVSKEAKIYFAQKQEFEDKFVLGVVKSLWDYYKRPSEIYARQRN